MGFAAMVNPSAAEVQALLEQLRAARPQGEGVVDDLIADLRHSTRRLEPGTARKILRSYGLTFETLSGETPEPDQPSTPPTPPTPTTPAPAPTP